MWLERDLNDDEMSFLRAIANTLATALARLRTEDRMRHEALHDPLTGLANRTLLRDRLEHALARSAREDGDRRAVHRPRQLQARSTTRTATRAGDAVLVQLGQRLAAAVRPADTVARLGGDEFVVVCEEVDEATALALARARAGDPGADPVEGADHG